MSRIEPDVAYSPRSPSRWPSATETQEKALNLEQPPEVSSQVLMTPAGNICSQTWLH